jgi:hypothetical protein
LLLGFKAFASQAIHAKISGLPDPRELADEDARKVNLLVACCQGLIVGRLLCGAESPFFRDQAELDFGN